MGASSWKRLQRSQAKTIKKINTVIYRPTVYKWGLRAGHSDTETRTSRPKIVAPQEEDFKKTVLNISWNLSDDCLHK